MKKLRFLLTLGLLILALTPPALAKDTDGDGLLDLLDAPGFDPNATGTVSFRSRGIEDLDGANQLKNAEFLKLGFNRISSIERGDFAGLPNLQSLFLDKNQITNLESGGFEGLDNLNSLVLMDNQITNIESGAFDGLANLRSVRLQRNRITSVEAGDFNGLANLNYLYLGESQISEVEDRRDVVDLQRVKDSM